MAMMSKPRRGLVFGQRRDYTWYGPAGHTHADARRIAGYPIGRRQSTGAVLYAAPGDDPERVAVWIPAGLAPGGHYHDVESWLD